MSPHSSGALDSRLLTRKQMRYICDLKHIKNRPINLDEDPIERERGAGDEATVVSKETAMLSRGGEVDSGDELERPS